MEQMSFNQNLAYNPNALSCSVSATAWIDPPQALVSKWQKMHGIVAGELLVLRSTPDYPAQDLAERALSAGTCHAVVMWTRKLGRVAFESLQRASAEGNSHGVVLRQR